MMADPALDPLGRQMIDGEIALSESAHEREVDSNLNFPQDRTSNDNKNFDTMTNPGIKCQGFDNESKDDADNTSKII